ncbi:hypothetical protein D3C84_797800 [compost metagenome]
MLANQLLGHQVTALLVVGHQAAQSIRAFTQQAHLVGRQRRVDHKQFHAAALRQAQHLRGNVLFVGEDQIVRTIGTLQCTARLRQREFRHAPGIENPKVDTQVRGGRLHELRIADPEGFVSFPGIQEQHRFRSRSRAVNRAEQQQKGVEKLQHGSSEPPEIRRAL